MRRLLVVVFFALLFCVLIVSTSTAQPAADQATTFIDVGQGDSALIQDGLGFDVLVDGGVTAEGPIVAQFLRDHGAADLEVMLATHLGRYAEYNPDVIC